MIKIEQKTKCCGCEACAAVCPKQCIEMKADYEGFLYPQVSAGCIDCGLCEKVCPIINPSDRMDVKKACALQIKDSNLRMESSSGGAFSAIANYVLQRKGTVYGVVIDEQMQIVHARAEFQEDLARMRGSKYVQSRIGDIYTRVKVDLDAGRKVLFSGTPCQVEGLLNYLRKPYDNLITADLVCHGVPSPKVWAKYIEYIEKKANSKIVSYSFRSKKTGYHDFGTEILFANGMELYTHDKGEEKDFMHIAFFNEICSRPSCHDCQFKTVSRRSDFTLFDCWHVSEFDKSMEDDLGTSAVFFHTDKSIELLKAVQDSVTYVEVDVKKITELDGNNVVYSMKPNAQRKGFFADLDVLSVDELQEKYLKPKKKNIGVVAVKQILRKMGIFEDIKQTVYKITKSSYKGRL